MIPLKAFSYKIYSDRILIDFLDSETYKEPLSDIIDFLNESVGKIINEKHLITLIEKKIKDKKKATLIFYALKYFYDLVDLTPLDEDKITKFFTWIQEKYGGHLPIGVIRKALIEFSKETHIDLAEISSEFISFTFRPKVLVSKHKLIDSIEVIYLANFLLLEKALSLAEEVYLAIKNADVMGQFIKKMVYKAKISNVLAEFEMRSDGLLCYFVGPHNFYKLSSFSSYGMLVSRIVTDALYHFRPWELKAILNIRGKPCLFRLRSWSEWAPRFKPPWISGLDYSFKDFDSTVERDIFTTLQDHFSKVDCRILREHDAIFLPSGKIFIPDFTIKCKDSKVLIEVIGFWTENYIRKKVEKLRELIDNNVTNIVLIIDASLGKFFEDIDLPKVFYRKGRKLDYDALVNQIKAILDDQK